MELQQFEVIEKYLFFPLLIANHLLVNKSIAPRIPSSLIYQETGIPGPPGVFIL